MSTHKITFSDCHHDNDEFGVEALRECRDCGAVAFTWEWDGDCDGAWKKFHWVAAE